jgi:hypothetical protein
MATKSWSTHQQKPIDEIFFQNDAVSLCLLVNRRARTMRVIDFRAGPSMAKRLFVLSLAQREGVDKVYTLVERDELATWIKLGFLKEGNIPGFYKRSDAFLLGSLVKPARSTRREGNGTRAKTLTAPADEETGVRLAVRPDPGAMTPEQERAERTVTQAKRLAKEVGDRAIPLVKVAAASESDCRRAVATALRSGRALTGFEPFGRDVERRHFVASGRGGPELWASAESQSCFGNVFLELLVSPRTDAEKAATTGALRGLCDRLLSEGVVSCFSLSPSDDVPLATAFAICGFRRTGLLASHMMVGGDRKDAILWARKLANPADE